MNRLPILLTLTTIVACGGEQPSPAAPAPATKSAVRRRPAAGEGASGGAFVSTGTSYEDALSIPEDLEAVKNEPELSDAELAGPLRNAAFVSDCGAPDSMKVTVRIAIRDGKALGAAVACDPENREVAECIDRAVRDLTWPPSRKRFSVTTRY
jgi:hypothetical protein